MIANVSKNNTGKLLVAVLAMFMIVAGAAVVLGSEVNATGDSNAEEGVASIGDQYYSTLDLAIKDATSGTPEAPTEIKLLKDTNLKNENGDYKLQNIIITADTEVTLTLNSAIWIEGTVGLENIKIAADGPTSMLFYTGYGGNITFSLTKVSFDESTTIGEEPLTIYTDKASTVDITDSDLTNTLLVYAGNDSAKPTTTITNSTNVDMNISSLDTVTIGTDIIIDGTSTIGDVRLAESVKLAVPEDVTFTAESIGQYNETSNGSIVTDYPSHVVAKVEGVPFTSTITGNVSYDAFDGALTVAEGSSLIVGDLTASSITNNGVIIVTGTLNYTGDNSIIIQTGIASTISAGAVYFTGDVTGISGKNFSVVAAQNPVDSEAYITNSITSIPADEEDVVIVALNVDLTGLTVTDNVTVAGTASGTVAMNGGTLTVGTADGLKVGNITFTEIENLTITGDDKALTVTSDVKDGTVDLGTLAEGEAGTVVTFANSVTITKMTVSCGEDSIILEKVTAGANGMTVSHGSIYIGGDIVIDGDSIVDADNDTLYLRDANITGEGAISVGTLYIDGTVTIGADVTIQVEAGAKIVVNKDALLTGEGTLKLVDATSGVDNKGTIEVNVDAPTDGVKVSDADGFVSALQYADSILVAGDLDFTGEEWQGRTVTVDGKTINFEGAVNVTVGDKFTLNFVDSTVNAESNVTITVKKGATIGIDNSDVYNAVDIEEGATVNATNNVTTITGTSTELGRIGFGKEIVFAVEYSIGSNSNVIVYGKITVAEGYTLNIDRTASVKVMSSGELNIEGTLNMGAKSLTVEGDMKVSGTMNMTGTMTVVDEGVVDVTGTMIITGTVTGVVSNHGTVDFNGTASEETGIAMYDGALLNVISVKGTLLVAGMTDYKPASDEEIDPELDTSMLTLTDVKGLSVDAVESIVAATKDTGAVITVVLDISGDVTAGTVGVAAYCMSANPEDVLTVTETLSLADKVVLDFEAGDYTIAGTINAAVGATITNAGTITVVGAVNVSAATANAAVIGGTGAVNAAYYNVSYAAVGETPAYVTKTYTSLATAVGATNADNSTIYVIGKLTVDEGETVTVPATLKLDYDGADDSLTVDGTLVFADYKNSCVDTRHINADVMFDETPARTYTSLANAIGMGITDIVLNDNVTIYGDMTIPAGVTVSSDEYGITVSATSEDGKKHSDVTLTVEGALELTAQDAGVELESYGTEGNSGYKEAALIVSGMGYVYLNTENTTSGSDFLSDLVSGAYYQIDADETSAVKVVDVIATVEKAAADSANVYASGNDTAITIKGEVTAAGDLTFTAGEDKALTVKVDGPTDTAFVGQTVTLVGDVTFDATDSSSATVTDGANAVALNKATGVTVSIEPDTDSDVEDATIFVMTGELVGKATVSSGTVYVAGTVSAATTEPAVAAAVLDIASGATMVVGATGLTVNGELSVEGTVQVPESVEITISRTGKATIGGTVEVTGTMNMNGNTQIDGTVAPADDAENAKIVVNSIVTVGSKPTEMGQTNAAILSGASYGEAESEVYIKAYNGATVEFADEDYEPVYTQLNIKGADSTGYYLYMTVYAGTETNLFTDVIYEEAFSLNGYDTGLCFNDVGENTGLYKIGNWYTSSDRVANTALTETKIVGFESNTAIYAQVALVKVAGTVSEGTGLNLYIDGVPANSGAIELSIGTHDVAFDVSAQYDGSNAVITLNGEAVTDGKITITSDMSGFVLAVSGATPAGTGEIVVNTGSGDMSLTDILLIILVVLIVIMAIIVALRLMRS